MIGRAVAWGIALVVVFATYQGVQAFKNPWSSAAVLPVTAVMPAMPDGCAKSAKCK